jgi:hypothetical protein
MATGILGTSDLSAGTDTTIYTVPADTYSVVSLNVCNRGNQAVALRIATAAADTPTDDEYIEYGVEVLGAGVLERTGIVLDAGKKLVVWASGANVSAVAMGIETPTV